jgi:hypothetical protein
MGNAALSDEVESVLWEAVKTKYPDRHDQRDGVIFDLLRSVFRRNPQLVERLDTEWQNRAETAKALAREEGYWLLLNDIIGSADAAVTRYPDDGNRLKRWWHQPVHALDGKKDGVDESASMDTLQECATAYMRARWADSPKLELWLLRQMLFAETYAFGREMGIPLQVKSPKVWWIWTKSTVKWLIGLAVAVGIGEAQGLAAGVLAYAVWLALLQYLAKDQIENLRGLIRIFTGMRNAYVMALRTPPCPVEIEKAMSLAESQGAIWPAGARSLLERALSRNRAMWELASPKGFDFL